MVGEWGLCDNGGRASGNCVIMVGEWASEECVIMVVEWGVCDNGGRVGTV